MMDWLLGLIDFGWAYRELSSDNALPFVLWTILMLAIGFSSGLFADRAYWRENAKRELEIAESLSRLAGDDPATNRVYREYRRRAVETIEDKIHGRTKLSIIVGTIVRGVPPLVITFFLYFVWLVTSLPTLTPSSFLGGTLAYAFIGFFTEGVFSTLRPFLRPVGERVNKIAAHRNRQRSRANERGPENEGRVSFSDPREASLVSAWRDLSEEGREVAVNVVAGMQSTYPQESSSGRASTEEAV